MNPETPKTKNQDASLDSEKKQPESAEAEGRSEGMALGGKPAAPSGDVPEEMDWQAEAKKYKDLYLRAFAEQENIKKRLEREKDEIVKFANENLIKELLTVLDNLERAIDHAEKGENNQESVIEGIRMTCQSFKDILKKFGVQPVAALGEKFDPQFHEAAMQEEDPNKEEGTIIKEIQRGYLLKDRLIRPAMVVVSKRTH